MIHVTRSPRIQVRRRLFICLGILFLPLVGCGGPGVEKDGTMDEATDLEEVITLGPRDGQDLPATELDRVAVGTVAPNFSLATLSGDTVTLSAFRGAKNVVLVFYRGHW